VACAPLIPIGIFAGLGLERLFMGDALARFVGQLPGSSAAQVERSMAAALRDPSLEIVYRRSGWEGYVDVDGSPVDITALGEDRAVVGIQQDGLVLAAVVFDSDLGHQRRFVAAAGEAALLWLAQARVEAELAASARELQVSRRRLLDASVSERRRIQRDLHDSTQQRLLAMSVKLGLAHDSLREQPRDAEVMLTGLQSELGETLAEVRSLVNGVYPPVLTDYGLLRALRGAARRSQTAVTLQAEEIGRHPAEVEGAVYFACLEALQNVDKHAGPRAHVTLRLWLEEGGLWFEVHDSGRGFEPDRVLAGAGLLSMRDRVEALDGTLSVTSHPGEGTAVAGTIPLSD
jgi:signal transduction histidine kinase